ncbi:IreB family regulatory phosphoprotein [Halanaerobium polyolivorans]|nr:IreB family regulatory phosphoprotein [Halanaerobium polyolivorans]RQD73299.1 MAG: IreB family regulatory phosphoprotein [Halanaerobium sp. MSAO_Bac5]
MAADEINDKTMRFKIQKEEISEAGFVLKKVSKALEEKGYNPISQIVGYLLSGDPAYITSYKDARTMIRTIDRDEIIEELLSSYLAE